MILVDTSVWTDHFRRSDLRLVRLLRGDEVGCHTMVIGELSLSSMPVRTVRVSYLSNLCRFPDLHDNEPLHLVETRWLWGHGPNLVDVSFIDSVLVVPGICLWTRDKRFRTVVKEPEVAFERESGSWLGRSCGDWDRAGLPDANGFDPTVRWRSCAGSTGFREGHSCAGPGFVFSKLVEPGSDEGTTRVETMMRVYGELSPSGRGWRVPRFLVGSALRGLYGFHLAQPGNQP